MRSITDSGTGCEALIRDEAFDEPRVYIAA
jgi:hypothetical protein